MTDDKWSMAMTNMCVCSDSKKQQPTSEYPYDLDQIKYIGVPISTVYIYGNMNPLKKTATKT